MSTHHARPFRRAPPARPAELAGSGLAMATGRMRLQRTGPPEQTTEGCGRFQEATA